MVRERLAYILINIFEVDITFNNGQPHAKEFIDDIVNELQILYTEMPTIELKETTTTTTNLMDIDGNINDEKKVTSPANTEYDNAIRLFKTGNLIFFFNYRQFVY